MRPALRLLAAFALGVPVGAVAFSGGQAIELLQTTLDAFIKVLDRHGLAVAISAFLVIAMSILTAWSLNTAISSKDAEIYRLVEEKKELHQRLMGETPTSGIGGG